jgi:hypothetical protein
MPPAGVALSDEDPNAWNAAIDERSYAIGRPEYQMAVLEQYKLYVEMADRTSQRRGQANTFFLTLNATLVTVLSSFLSTRPIGPAWLVFPLVALLVECGTWFFLVRSYRMLNSKKFRIINSIEDRLPVMPWKTEWLTLAGGNGPWRYWRLTLLEQWSPIIFAIIYVSSYCAYVLR